MVTIGNAQGFWGDRPNAARQLLEQQPDLDFLTMDYLAEVSLSIMAIQQQKDPTAGYARDFLDTIRSLIPLWRKGLKTRIICNAGGLNPKGCAAAVIELLASEGLNHLTVGLVTGDDVREVLQKDRNNTLFANSESKCPLSDLTTPLNTANAYIGAEPIVRALDKGADIVITGRVADPSLTVAACVYHYGWALDEYDKIAGATVAGHLIECGTQVCGGFSTHWMELKNPAQMGYPIVEVAENGSCIVTKPDDTGGAVTIETVKEQLIYEIGDPARYLSPDATVSFRELEVKITAPNRIAVSGAQGYPPPPTYKVSATYHDGFRAEGMLIIVGDSAPAKARRCGEVILDRLERQPQRSVIEILGTGGALHGVLPQPTDCLECVLRVAVADSDRSIISAFCKEVAPLVTSGPQGITGYASGRPKVRPIYAYWPCLIEREQVSIKSATFNEEVNIQ
ncbi:Uncharacterized protein SCG7086_AA_00620 [Chlamydiales bacterium SCGC AG-110-P3]|nr:Uncharacterized protein SCG7086_AA_00620 [Chlamydiales bacterium SCGC AG-110-P3]